MNIIDSDKDIMKDLLLITLLEDFCINNHFNKPAFLINELAKSNIISTKVLSKNITKEKEALSIHLKNIIRNLVMVNNAPIHLANKRLKEFEILKTIYDNINSSVYEVKSKIDKGTYALKRIPLYNFNKKQLNEVINMAKLDHPNILRYYSAWIENDGEFCLFIQTELCQRTLEDYIYTEKNYDMNNIINQLYLGLEYLHSNNIIHRDLKPSNVFIKDDIIKIGDFGLSRTLEYTNNETTDIILKPRITNKIGTELYASPEQLSNKNYDYTTDYYSLGIIYYEMVLAQKHDKIDTTFKIQAFKKSNRLRLNDKEVKNKIKTLTHKDPNKRFFS